MNRSSGWVSKVVASCCLVLAGCGKGAAPDDVSARAGAVNRPTVYVPKAGYWSYSATGGDLGPGWYQQAAVDWQWSNAPLGYGESYVGEIPYGSDPAHKPTTVYFRTSFYVPNVAFVHSLWLHMMYDDGFVAYINGHEVQRAHLPAGPVSHGTLATGHEANDTYESFDLASARAFLRDGSNSLAVEVHQVSPSSSDLVFDASLDGDAWVDPPPPAYYFISGEAKWSFYDKGDDLGTAWRQSNYDASAWDFGQGPLGYGEPGIVTPVSYGPDPSNKRITTYFRKQVIVDQPDSVISIGGYALFDDGFVIYLNGQRIGSDSMPAGPITASTLALPHESGTTYTTYDWSAYRHLLVQGLNTFAVEVHQAAAYSSDLVFNLYVGLTSAPPAPAPAQTISRGSVWSYRDQGTDLGTAWRDPSYDDAAWATGAGPLGYGETYLRTTTSSGANPNQKPITTYFRRHFVVDAPPSGQAIAGVYGELMFDDGAVVYINGHEVQRVGLPVGTLDANTRAYDHEAGNAYVAYDWSAAKDWLVVGDNVIAVEIHQTAATSSDVVFDLSLDVEAAPQFTKYAGNPVVVSGMDAPSWQAIISSPSVVKVADRSWVMFYTGTDGGPHDMLGRATSTDGLVWTRDPDPVDPYGTRPAVVYDGRYHLWASQVLELGQWYSWSSDGITFNRNPSKVVDGAFEASVIKDGDVFRMWYGAPGGMGYATSTDGVTWTHHPSVVFDHVGWFTVIKDGGEFKMWFAESTGLIYASSPDGIHWRRHGLSLPVGGVDAWDQTFSRASVVRDEGVLKMWYGGYGTARGGFGYATSP
jgi:hypothetical protein